MRKAAPEAGRNIARLVARGDALQNAPLCVEQDHIDVRTRRGIVERGLAHESADEKAVRAGSDMRRDDLPRIIGDPLDGQSVLDGFASQCRDEINKPIGALSFIYKGRTARGEDRRGDQNDHSEKEFLEWEEDHSRSEGFTPMQRGEARFPLWKSRCLSERSARSQATD